VVGSVRIGDERRSFAYRDGRMSVHPGGYGLYLVNSINTEELVIGAKYVGKKFEASTMHSSQRAVATHGGTDLVTMAVVVLLTAAGVVIYRRRYRGIVMQGANRIIRFKFPQN
jgi:hypothetical protein